MGGWGAWWGGGLRIWRGFNGGRGAAEAQGRRTADSRGEVLERREPLRAEPPQPTLHSDGHGTRPEGAAAAHHGFGEYMGEGNSTAGCGGGGCHASGQRVGAGDANVTPFQPGPGEVPAPYMRAAAHAAPCWNAAQKTLVLATFASESGCGIVTAAAPIPSPPVPWINMASF